MVDVNREIAVALAITWFDHSSLSAVVEQSSVRASEDTKVSEEVLSLGAKCQWRNLTKNPTLSPIWCHRNRFQTRDCAKCVVEVIGGIFKFLGTSELCTMCNFMYYIRWAARETIKTIKYRNERHFILSHVSYSSNTNIHFNEFQLQRSVSWTEWIAKKKEHSCMEIPDVNIPGKHYCVCVYIRVRKVLVYLVKVCGYSCTCYI